MTLTPPLPVTFGIEVEFVYAKHSDMIPDDVRLDEWLLRDFHAMLVNRHRLNVELDEDGDVPDFLGNWILTQDFSAKVWRDADMPMLFDGNPQIDVFSYQNWHNDGLELISRILPLPSTDTRVSPANDSALAEIAKYLAALQTSPGSELWFVRTTKDCGLHVHIGVGPGDPSLPQIPLLVLQHLAYIILEYEDVISCLHQGHRRGFSKTNAHVGSNKFGVHGNVHSCGQKRYNVDLESVQDQIFHKEMTFERLGELMSASYPPSNDAEPNPTRPNSFDRDKFVNWENIRQFNSPSLRSYKPPTVEFRQHESTFDVNAVSHWIRFLAALLRLAERRAAEATPPNSPSIPFISRAELTWPQREGRKYRFRCVKLQDRIFELFDVLGLDRAQQQYWIRRYNGLNPNSFTGKPYAELCVECQVTGKLKDPDAQDVWSKRVSETDEEIDERRRQSGREDEPFTAEEMEARDKTLADIGEEMLQDQRAGTLQQASTSVSDMQGVIRTSKPERKGPYSKIKDSVTGKSKIAALSSDNDRVSPTRGTSKRLSERDEARRSTGSGSASSSRR